jgi:hypothetical protein
MASNDGKATRGFHILLWILAIVGALIFIPFSVGDGCGSLVKVISMKDSQSGKYCLLNLGYKGTLTNVVDDVGQPICIVDALQAQQQADLTNSTRKQRYDYCHSPKNIPGKAVNFWLDAIGF